MKIIEVELPDRLSNYRLPKTVDDPKKAVQASLALLDVGPKKIMYPALGITYLAPMTSFFDDAGFRPAFVLYLWGLTGAMKSTLMALMLCHFGTFSYMTLPASFRGTTFSVEQMGYTLKDVLFVVDDLKRTNDRFLKQDMFKTLGNLLRIYGDRQDRSRLEPNMKSSGMELQKLKSARGLLAVTGEYNPTDGSSPSDLARMFSLPIKKDDLDVAKLSDAQGKSDLLAQAMVSYLRYLIPKLDLLPERLGAEFIERRTMAQKAAKVAGRHARLDSAVAHLYIGLKMFFEFAVAIEAMTQEEMTTRLDEAWKVLNQVADEQTELGKKHDEAQVLSEVYSELMAQNLIYTLPIDGPIQTKSGFDVDVDPHRPKTLIGYGPDENGLYYILMKTLIDKANDLLKGQGEINNLITVDGVLDALNSKGLLEIVKKKDGTYYDRLFQKRLQGKLRPVSAIKEKFFNQPDEVAGEGV